MMYGKSKNFALKLQLIKKFLDNINLDFRKYTIWTLI